MSSSYSLCLLVLLPLALISSSHEKLHASCKIHWKWSLNCTTVNELIISQIKAWNGEKGCDQGGEKCLYNLKESSPDMIKATHETPKKHYVDDLTFNFTKSSEGCAVEGFSTSEVWYAVLDYGTNYCNLHNLITGSKLDKAAGYVEETSDSICTQYSSRNCDKY
ncbi:uncharacterized protein LOC110254661 [Exaiptasia diaphana]|uniref:Uncharacterized protein n=1 Tax=Exaiptasia diaphana TaxID=2652724 RepID=A0A913YBV5_EXADI|nr:uncharacterized protein LOC110254661 [Exaiptasia diaphana]KXJ28282.1 hypothetical protein AC249_AIPGENE5842 [Exaiptasia diaphana]